MRDMSYEHIGIYRTMVEKIVKNACAVFISSDGYRQYLPVVSKYILCIILISGSKSEGLGQGQASTYPNSYCILGV